MIKSARAGNRGRAAGGFSLIEVMIAVAIVTIGLLGLAGLQARAHQAEVESFARAQALLMLQDMSDRISTNLANARDGQYAAPLLGVPGTDVFFSGGVCAGADTLQNDLCEWDRGLKGASEQQGTVAVGAVANARGCIEFDDANDRYVVSVAWQGIGDFGAVDPGVTCASAVITANRRVVVHTIQLSTLSSVVGGP